MSVSATSSTSTGIRSRTVIGPLTTTFTPPAACFTAVLDCPTCDVGFLGFECLGSGSANPNYQQAATTCLPKASEGAPKPEQPLGGWGFYSPGLICPSGYYSACTATASGMSEWNVQFLMTQGETAVGCCPRGFTCASSKYQHCARTVMAGDQIPLSQCFIDRIAFASYTIPSLVTPIVSSPSTTFSFSDFGMFAPMVEIVWQSSDHAVTTTPTSITSTPETASASTTISSLRNSDGNTHASGLSTGVKIALGATIPVVTIAMIAIIFLYCQRRIRRSKVSSSQEYSLPRGLRQSVLLESMDKRKWRKTMLELEDSSKPQEMEGERIYEVDGTSIGDMRHRS